MTRNKKFGNESQDARRHDKQKEAHPNETQGRHPSKSTSTPNKSSHSNAQK
jgi:hypothetical protein